MASNRTRNQDRILKTLQALNREIAAQDLYIYLQELGQKVGLATVYRSLEALKKQGEIQVRALDSGMSLYSSIQRDRHHLNCVKCGRSEPIDECPLHGLQQELQTRTNFKIFYHTLEFHGLCRACQEGEAGDPDTKDKDHADDKAAVTAVNVSASRSSSYRCC